MQTSFLHDMMCTTKAKGEGEGDENKNDWVVGAAGDDDPTMAASLTAK